MFANAFQSGAQLEVFDSKVNRDKNEFYQNLFKATPATGVKKEFDKTIKQYLFEIQGQTTKLVFPKDDHKQLCLVQQYLVVQIFVPQGAIWSLELSMTDTSKTKRRINFTSAINKAETKYFHVRYPLDNLKKNVWLNLCIDVFSFMGAFKGQTFRSLDQIVVGSTCKLRRIYTMRDRLYQYSNDDEFEPVGSGVFVPKQFQLPPDIVQCSQFIAYDEHLLMKESIHLPNQKKTITNTSSASLQPQQQRAYNGGSNAPGLSIVTVNAIAKRSPQEVSGSISVTSKLVQAGNKSKPMSPSIKQPVKQVSKKQASSPAPFKNQNTNKKHHVTIPQEEQQQHQEIVTSSSQPSKLPIGKNSVLKKELELYKRQQEDEAEGVQVFQPRGKVATKPTKKKTTGNQDKVFLSDADERNQVPISHTPTIVKPKAAMQQQQQHYHNQKQIKAKDNENQFVKIKEYVQQPKNNSMSSSASGSQKYTKKDTKQKQQQQRLHDIATASDSKYQDEPPIESISPPRDDSYDQDEYYKDDDFEDSLDAKEQPPLPEKPTKTGHQSMFPTSVITKKNGQTVVVEVKGEPDVELIYDQTLECYYNPKTNMYYEIS